MKKKIAIVVGHQKEAPGAFGVAPINEYEYEFNTNLAQALCVTLMDDFEPVIYFRDGKTILQTYDIVSQWGPDASLELHFNSCEDIYVRGTETLVGPGHEKFGKVIQNAMVSALKRDAKTNRGVKVINFGDHDRGWANVDPPPWPNAIIEPFFGSNQDECCLALDSLYALCQALRQALLTGLV